MLWRDERSHPHSQLVGNPLGAIATLPQNLRIALSILLSSQFPMQIL
uniref:Uncharacterized protein n=1 Tax=Desertifilum tharense IPPAS B-1220 TaxID=1781255 RepID=A0ACD5GPV9_9CYAN